MQLPVISESSFIFTDIIFGNVKLSFSEVTQKEKKKLSEVYMIPVSYLQLHVPSTIRVEVGCEWVI
jgi:hypothetical protein